MTDRYLPFRQVAKDLGVEALALVPGCNFERLYRKSFSSHERPLVVFIPAQGDPAALVPNLELRSFDLLNFEGAVFDWRGRRRPFVLDREMHTRSGARSRRF